ncbi:XrtA/PEP-CTERM system TPR-repeat protein PrsT [Paraglaciecola sp. MB-3u-78]|uniref:XrtA/PEP-CTERM system TPR-repeat protein PrsT n=1 Tax=Paraglaciecola sp. MB-3u-78 TaxID=2058332 RepID=UPI000C340349|nr:XrtA/PEP-CTERM system TPR-repeat protein PrsT [Paraglaciecola sp. MB-3u-78]PKG98202.1 PEP-CTERM system TPR-repeat protein PrsT [Paraglaciecola sp. MB-3u-78]
MKGLNSTLLKYALTVVAIGVLSGCGKQTSDQYIQEAKQYVAENDPAAAIVALKNAVQLEPKLAQARFELGLLYIQQKQFESAEKELNRALEYGFEPSKVLPLLTQAYQQTGAYSAISKLEHGQQGLTSVERAEIGYFKVVALARLNKIDAARVLIEELREIETSSVFKGLTAAYMLVLDENYETAATAVSELREQAPQNAEVLKLLAQLKLSLGKPAEAADIFKDYVQFYPEDKQTTFVLAKLLVDVGDLKAADPYIDELLLLNDQNPLLNQLKSATYAYKGDYANALKRAEFAFNGGIEAPSLRLVAGYAAYQIQDYSSANRHLTYIAGILPDNHPGLKLLAASQLQLGLSSEAGDVLGRLDQLTDEDAPLFSKASYELLRDGFEKEAKVLIEKSTSISRTAEDLTRLGLLQLSLNNLDGIVNLEEAVSKSPELESAQTTLAKAYLVTQQYDKALELANNWKNSSPDDAKPYMLAGDVYTKQQKFTEAKIEFEKAIAQDSKSPSPRLALVNLAVVQKDMQQARLLLEQLLIEFPNNVPTLATYYLINKQANKELLGIVKIQSAFERDPTNIATRLLLARVQVVENNYQAAIDLLTEVKDQNDLPRAYWKTLGQGFIKSNQLRPATLHYDAWLAKEPNDKDAIVGKLLLLDNLNKFEEASKLTQGYLNNRDDVQMQLLNTHFLLMQGDYPTAQKAYDALPKNVLGLPIAKGFLARFQLNNKQPELALENALIAYNATPNNRNLILLVFTYDKLQQLDKSMELLVQHIEKLPNDLGARMLLAERQIGEDLSGAIASYEVALQQNPNNYIANNNLAYLYLQEGDINKARGYGEKAVELKPDNAAALDTLAQIYMADKDYEGALNLYDRAITDAMQNEEIYLNYVEALLLAEETVLAKRKLSQREMKQKTSITREAKLRADFGIE